MEHFITHWTNCYVTGVYNVNPESPNIDFEETQKLYDDSHYAALSLAKHVEVNYGKIDKATFTGEVDGARKLTGKNTSADIILDVRDYGQLGISHKYTKKGNPRRLKIFAPTPFSFAKRIDLWTYGALFEMGTMEERIRQLTDDKMSQAETIAWVYDETIKELFGEVSGPLKKKQLSHLRKIIRGEIEYHDRDGVEKLYNILRIKSSNHNRTIAGECFTEIVRVMEASPKSFRDEIFRSLANIPEPGDPAWLHTLLVNTIRTPASPKVDIYDIETDIDRYITSLNGEYPLNKRSGTCVFRIGALNVEINTRAGDRNSGAVNITIDKKILNGLQNISERSKDQET